MLTHEPKVVAARQVSNEQVSYRIVCCEEKCEIRADKCQPAHHVCEDSWHTMSIHSDDHEWQLAAAKAKVAARHAKMTEWRGKHQANG